MGAQSQAIARSLTARIELAAKALVLEIVANLIAATPVDTGWARANWLATIGSPATSAVGSPEAPDASAQQAGMAAVLQFTINQAVMYVSNHVPYITVLNYGHSKQAPALFVEYCVDQALHTIQAKFAELDMSALRAANTNAAIGKIKAHGVVRAFHALAG